MTTENNQNPSEEKNFKLAKDSNVDNSKLEKAIKNFFESHTPINQKMLLEELLKAQVIIPITINGTVEKENNNIIIKKDTDIRFILLQNAENEKYCPAFTNSNELSKYGEKRSGSIMQNFIDLAKYILNPSSGVDGIAINPFGDLSITLNKEQLKAVVDPALNNSEGKEYTISKNENVLVGDPKIYPTKAVEIMSATLANHHCINQAFLRLLVRPQSNKTQNMSYLVIIETSDHDATHLFEDLAILTKEHLDGIPLDFIKYDKNSSFIMSAIKDCKPFYKKKKKFGLFG